MVGGEWERCGKCWVVCVYIKEKECCERSWYVGDGMLVWWEGGMGEVVWG